MAWALTCKSRFEGKSFFIIQMQIVFRYVYLSEQEVFSEFNVPESLVWKKEGLVYGSWDQGPNSDSIFELQTQVKASESLQNNGSLYLHAFLVRAGKSPDPATGKGMFSKKWTTYKKARLNKFMKRKYKKTTNLLTGETEQSVEDQEKAEQGLTEVITLLSADSIELPYSAQQSQRPRKNLNRNNVHNHNYIFRRSIIAGAPKINQNVKKKTQ